MSAPRTGMRLPPLRVLRVKEPNRPDVNPCINAMSSVLACWASVGYNTAGCAAVEASLRTCMDTKKTRKTWPNNVNYHLGRFQKRLNGAVKHKGSKD